NGRSRRFDWSDSHLTVVNGDSIQSYAIDSWELERELHVPRARLVATGCGMTALGLRGQVQVFEDHSGEPSRTLNPGASSLTDLRFSPRCDYLAASATQLTVWKTGDWRALPPLAKGGGTIRSIAWSPDGEYLALGQHDGVRLFSTSVWEEEQSFKADKVVTSVGWSADNTKIAAAAKSLLIWDVVASKLAHHVRHSRLHDCDDACEPMSAVFVSFSPTSELVVTHNEDFTSPIRLWERDSDGDGVADSEDSMPSISDVFLVVLAIWVGLLALFGWLVHRYVRARREELQGS
ncbi:MAG: hypothetical protein HN348_34090, partial [Proteobacteria bacterium]|nr:hypothetical protein [Pseudomonadota bacterium]